MWIVIRDLTLDKDIEMDLPTELYLNPEHEYIIVDHDNTLEPNEYTNIKELNDFLLECKKNDISDETLKILSASYLFEEVIYKIKKEDFTIVDFDFVTAMWFSPNINSDREKGLVLFEEGYMQLPFEFTREMEDWIRWENLWDQAESEGWRVVKLNGYNYLVR